MANVLPTTIGGDVLRVSRLAQDNGRVHDSFASVVLERLTGWLVLPVITFLGLLLNPPLQDLGEATQVAFSLACGTLVALVLVVGAVAARRWGDMDATKGWKRFLAAVSLGLNALRTHPRQAASVVAVGFAYQLVLVAAAVMAARALGIPDAGPTALLAFFPAVAIAQVLPISISGLGVREGLFVLFLKPLGVPTGQAVALGILLYLLNLIVSLLGAPAFAIGGRRRADGGPRGPEDEDAPAPPPAPGGAVTQGSDRAPPTEVPRPPRLDRPGHRRGARRPERPARRPAATSAGGGRSSTSSAFYVVYSWIRNQFGSAGERRGPDRLRARPGHHRHPGRPRPVVRARAAALVPGPAGRRPDPGLEHLLRHRPLRGHRRRAHLALPPPARPVLGVAHDPGGHDGPGPDRLRHVLPDAAPAARVHHPVRRLLPAGAGLPGRRGIVDTLDVHGGWLSFEDDQVASVSNQYAAMPSMHTGWSTWSAFVLWGLVRRRWLRALVVLYPVATVFCIMVTGNHYWLDAAGGLVAFGRLPDRPGHHPAGPRQRLLPRATQTSTRRTPEPAAG